MRRPTTLGVSPTIKQRMKKAKNLPGGSRRIIKSNVVKIVTHNANGLDEGSEYDTRALISKQSPDLVGIVETKLRLEDGRRELEIKGYRKFEARRSDGEGDRKGGGIMVLAKESSEVKYEMFEFKISGKGHEYVQKERLWITRRGRGGTKVAFCFVYMAHQTTSPVHDLYGEWNDGIYEVLEEEIRILRKRGFKIHLSGDMNAWIGAGEGGIEGNDPRINKNGERMRGFLERTGMKHINGEAVCTGLFTRHCGSASTVLDYVCVASEDVKRVKSLFIDEFGSMGGHSDHVYIVSKLEVGGVTCVENRVQSVKKSAWAIDEDTDWETYRDIVDRELESVPEDAGVEELGLVVTEAILEGLEEGIGKVKVKTRSSKIYPLGVLKEMAARTKKSSIWRKARSLLSRVPSEENRRKLGEVTLDMDIQKEKTLRVMESYWNRKRGKVIEILKTKTVRATKMFWQYVRNRNRQPVVFLQLEDHQTGELVGEQQQMKGVMERFLKHLFKGEFEVQENKRMEEQLTKEEGEGPGMMEELGERFTKQEVKESIDSLKNGKARGVDKIPHEAVKNGSSRLLEVIVKLFNRIQLEGRVPKGWKEGRVVIVHKTGSVTDLVNYLPLTVLVSLSGLFSRVLNLRLTKVVEDRKILGEIQNGFRKGRTGADNNFILHTILMKCSATGRRPDMAFIDIRKV